MKTIKLIVSQDDTTFTQIIDVTNDNFNVVIGTSLNRLFEFQSALVKCNDKGRFKYSQPLSIIIDTENEVIATTDLLSTSQAGLKLGNTAKAKKRFANKVYTLLDFAYSMPREMEYLELIKELDVLIAE